MSEIEETDGYVSAVLPVSRCRGLFIYRRLRPAPLRLSILKLDGSCFDVEVMTTAKVGELKVAVVQAFFQISWDEGLVISWSHVWSQFCLCYKDQMLVDDKRHLGFFGIEDGDQLCFIRRVSSYHTEKRRRNTEILLMRSLLCK